MSYKFAVLEKIRKGRGIHGLGGDDGGSGGNQNVVTKSQPPDFQLGNLNKLMSEAGKYLAGPTPTYFPGSTVAGQRPEQIAGQNQVVDYATGNLPDLTSNAIASNQFSLGAAMDPGSNPYLLATAENAAVPILRGFEQIDRPEIQNQALAAGQFGGSRQGIAEGIAGQGALDAVARNTYGLFNDAYARGQDNAIKAQAIAPSLLGAGTLPGTLVSGVGDVQQGQTQNELNDQVNRFNFDQNADLAQLQQFQNLIGGNFGGTTTSQGTAQQSSSRSPLSGALGGASLGASIGSVIPGLGTGWGAAVGGVLGLLGLV